MKREVYEHMNEQLTARPETVEGLVKRAHRNHHIVLKKVGISVAAAAVLCCGVSFGASANEDFREALYAISPRVGEFFTPVMESSTFDGIRMTVEAAYYNDEKAEVIVAFEDMTGQGRAETIDLCDTYELRRGVLPYSGGISSSGITSEYDPETGINRKHIYIDEEGTIDKEGEMLTFSVGKIAYGMEEAWSVRMPVDLSEVTREPEMRTAEETLVYKDRWGGMGANFHVEVDPRRLMYLAPQEPIRVAEGIRITAVGWSDGYLHIQTYCDKNLDTTSVGFYLNSDPERPQYTVIWSPEKGVKAEETFIGMEQEELNEVYLRGYYIAGGTEIKGNWKVRFPLEKKTDEIVVQNQ